MGKRAKRGKAQTFAIPMAARVAVGAVAVAALGYGLLFPTGERATGTKAVRARSPSVINSGLRLNACSCISSDAGFGSAYGPGASGRTAQSG
ncbi:hypothetical protein ACVWZK_006131 [Bradyrhizobium sp. GM0.4]